MCNVLRFSVDGKELTGVERYRPLLVRWDAATGKELRRLGHTKEELANRVQALAPKPWPVDRETARQAVDKLQLGGPAQAVYYADGLDDPALAPLARVRVRIWLVPSP